MAQAEPGGAFDFASTEQRRWVNDVSCFFGERRQISDGYSDQDTELSTLPEHSWDNVLQFGAENHLIAGHFRKLMRPFKSPI